MLLYYNPATEDDSKLRQCLAVFFPAFSFSSTQRRSVFESSFLMILRKIMYAPSSSLLRKVNVVTVAQYLLYLMDVTNGLAKKQTAPKSKKKKDDQDEESECSSSSSDYPTNEDAAFHIRIGIKLAQEILTNPTGF